MIPDKLVEDYQVEFPYGDPDEEFALRYAKAAWSAFSRGSSGVDYSFLKGWNTWRLYGAGKQPSFIYETWAKNTKAISTKINESPNQYNIDSKKINNYLRKAWKNVDFTVISFIPKIKSIIKGALENADYNVKVYAIDSFSRDSEEEQKWKFYVENVEREFLDGVRELIGLQAPDMPVKIDSIKELQLLSDAEGFKVNWAIALEKICRFSFEMSGYKEQRDMLIDDLLDGGMAVVKDDVVNGFIQHKYVDPEMFIIQFSNRSDYADAQYAGHLEYVPLSEIASKVGHDAAKNIVSFYNENQVIPESEWGRPGVMTGSNGLNDYIGKVLVLNLSFIANEYDYYREINYWGRTKIKRVDKNYKKKGDSKIVKYPRPMLFEVKWVVGTDCVYEFGPVFNQPKDRNNNVRLNYHVYALPVTSLVQQLIPLEDEYMKGWLLYQAGVNGGFKSGIALNTAMLKNVTLDGQAADPIELIAFYKEERVMPYGQSHTGEYRGGAVSPVVPIQGISEMVINEAVNRKRYVSEMVYDIVGIDVLRQPIVNGQNVGMDEIRLESVQLVVKPIVHALLNIKDSLAKNMALRVQNLVAYDEEFAKRYSGILNNSEVEMLKLAEKSDVIYSVVLKAKPTRDDVMSMMQSVQASYSQGLLDPHDYMYIMEQILNDVELGKIRQFVAYKIEKRRQEMQQQQMAAIDRQNQGLAMVNQSSMEQQMALLDKKIQGKIEEVTAKYQGELVKEREITNRELEKVIRKIMANG
jgi:hypothetical protein